MALLKNTEKGILLKLFNRGGYVLDFSTAEFDTFTLSSIGEALCNKYKASKGASITSYIHKASDTNAAKLLVDLFDYYELSPYFKETTGSDQYALMYKQCKPIIERVKAVLSNTTIPIEDLKDKFSSEYISTQLDTMLKMQNDDPTEAIGKSKELIESCCKTILNKKNIEIDKKWNIVRLVDETVKLLKENIAGILFDINWSRLVLLCFVLICLLKQRKQKQK